MYDLPRSGSVWSRALPRVSRVLLASALVASLAILASPDAVRAEPEANAEYEGAMSDGGSARIVVNADRTAVEATFVFSKPPTGCPTQAYIARIPIGAGGVQFRADRQAITGEVTRNIAIPLSVSVAGFWDVPGYYAATGSVAVDPGTGSCPAVRASWRAGRSNGTLPTGVGRGYVFAGAGSVYAVGSATAGGTVKASTTEFGTGIASLSFTFKDGQCSYEGSTSGAAANRLLFDAGPSLQYADDGARAWSMAAVSAPESLSGGLVVAGTGSCPTVALYYVAELPRAAAPAPAPAVAASVPAILPPGTFVSAPEFNAETFLGPAVFTGGTVDNLEAATLALNASGVWVRDVGGEFRLLELGSPASREAFKARFPNGILPMTPATVSRAAGPTFTTPPAGTAAPAAAAPATPAAAASGAFAAPPAFGAGKQAYAVFMGGTVAQLSTAAAGGGATGVWAQDSTGAFYLLVIGGPAFLNEGFTARFPSGFTTATAVTLTR